MGHLILPAGRRTAGPAAPPEGQRKGGAPYRTGIGGGPGTASDAGPDAEVVAARRSSHRPRRDGQTRHPVDLRQTAPPAAVIIPGSFCGGTRILVSMRAIRSVILGVDRKSTRL